MREKRITNIDTLSAFLDRLITENIKLFFFKKEKSIKKIEHQEKIVLEIRKKIRKLLIEIFTNGYDYISEKRTFVNNILENIEELITNDINIGESDRQRLKVAMMEEKRLRKSNEGRSRNKNNIDENLKKLTEE
jgi:hypothetical protein